MTIGHSGEGVSTKDFGYYSPTHDISKVLLDFRAYDDNSEAKYLHIFAAAEIAFLCESRK
jgi:hypothetical protein